jgi:hypothetical protein
MCFFLLFLLKNLMFYIFFGIYVEVANSTTAATNSLPAATDSSRKFIFFIFCLRPKTISLKKHLNQTFFFYQQQEQRQQHQQQQQQHQGISNQQNHHQQHQQRQQQQPPLPPPPQHQQQQQQSGAGGQKDSPQTQRRGSRGDYGQLRYGDQKAKENQRVIMKMTNFQLTPPEGYKGPAAFEGGWGGRRDHLPRWVIQFFLLYV